MLATEEMTTATLKVISATAKVILTTEEVITTILKFISATTKLSYRALNFYINDSVIIKHHRSSPYV